MTATARLARSTAVATFALIVFGAIVRATGSGLACPDWPLCHGRILPPLQPQVLFEWGHRAVALLVSLSTAALAVRILIVPAQRRALGGLIALALALLATQVLLGALTVWKLLHFSVVTMHLGNALLFFAVLLAIAERADRAPEDAAGATPASVPTRVGAGAGRRLWWFAAAAILAQSLLGGLVSTNHAGLACPDWPLCHGEVWPTGEGPLVHLQLAHRAGAYVLAAFLAWVWARSRRAADPRVRAGGEAVLGLVLVQIVLGVFNVLLAVPVWLTAAHLATATALFAVAVITALRAEPRGRAVPGIAS